MRITGHLRSRRCSCRQATTFTETGIKRATRTTDPSNLSRSRPRASTGGYQPAMTQPEERSRPRPTTGPGNCWVKLPSNTCMKMNTEIGLNSKSGLEQAASQRRSIKLLIGLSHTTQILRTANGNPQLLKYRDSTHRPRLWRTKSAKLRERLIATVIPAQRWKF
jgi:hypothetical protein